MKSICQYNTKIGCIAIADNGRSITNLFFDNERITDDFIQNETPLIMQAHVELEEYLDGRLRRFSLPMEPSGTEFMGKVWQALQTIGYAQTASYKDIATMIGNSKACRAVGMANNKNPIPIFIPCHRIIGANKKLVGYAGGIDLKEKLLNIEKANS